jgi:ATP-binding cassette, subfamily B, bacterial PglK
LSSASAYVKRILAFVSDVRLVLGDGVRKLPWLLALMLLMTVLDVFAVIAVAPFLARIVGSSAAVPGLLRQYTDAWSLRTLGLLVVVAFALKGATILWVQRRITKLAEGERAHIMSRLLASFQSRPYQYHLLHNTTQLITTVLWYSQAFTMGVLHGGLQVFANGLVLLVLAVLLAFTNLPALLVLFTGMGLVLVVVATLVRPAAARAVEQATGINARLIQSTGQALGGLREIRLLNREEYFRDDMDSAAKRMVDALVTQATLSQVPRQVVEVSMVGFLVLIVWVMTRSQGNMEIVVPVLGTFATAGLRLMPASTALLSSWNGLRSHAFSVRALAEVLREQEGDMLTAAAPTDSEPFVQLELDAVHYRYAGATRDAINGITINVRRGEALGIMGRSGAGKSSLADMVLGLLAPTQGSIRVNGWEVADQPRRWQAMTAYIPQAAFLIDDTLRRNIALGLADADIDETLLRAAIFAAQLTDTVDQLPHGVETLLGERGVRLSGGQRQRVAIARALYYRRQFLVLDEATSALDVETERAVVDAINALAGSVTMIVIAHRHSTLAACNRIVTLANGRIVDIPAETIQIHESSDGT